MFLRGNRFFHLPLLPAAARLLATALRSRLPKKNPAIRRVHGRILTAVYKSQILFAAASAIAKLDSTRSQAS